MTLSRSTSYICRTFSLPFSFQTTFMNTTSTKMWRLILFVTLCGVIKVNSYRNNEQCVGCRNIEYTRVKRGKYFFNPPAKFYNRPPNSHSIKGPFSYTPPPGYTPNDIGAALTSHIRPYQVSKIPTNEGLGDEDINNIIKYLSKKDLNKLIKFATESERFAVAYREPTERINNQLAGPDSNYNNVIYNDSQQDYKSSKNINGPNARPGEYKQYNIESNENTNYFTNSHQVPVNNNHIIKGQLYSKEESRQEEQLSSLDAYIQKEIKEVSPEKSNIYSDSRTMQEEPLPRPSNLRHNDFETSFTNNVPRVVKPELSYELKNFADLPLMNYENSKLDTVNSYNVPHYSVTSFQQQGSKISFPSPPLSLMSPLKPSHPIITAVPEVEPAPPVSVAKDQTDAHLKAIKIWTHKSKGTAYTLHDDGTLSLERPMRPKIKFA